MAYDISNFDGTVIPPDATDPNGRVKDESSLNAADGTVVNDKSLGSWPVVYRKLMQNAGIAPNNLPENDVNGFQIIDAIKAIAPPDNSVGTAKIQDDAVTPDKIADDAVTNDAMASNSVDSDQYVDKSIESIHLGDNIDIVKTTSILNLDISLIDIGYWNMDSDTTRIVPHGLSSFNDIVFCYAQIFSDAGELQNLERAGRIEVFPFTPNYITLYRDSGGYFDSSNFSNPSNNRGRLVIIHVRQ